MKDRTNLTMCKSIKLLRTLHLEQRSNRSFSCAEIGYLTPFKTLSNQTHRQSRHEDLHIELGKASCGNEKTK